MIKSYFKTVLLIHTDIDETYIENKINNNKTKQKNKQNKKNNRIILC